MSKYKIKYYADGDRTIVEEKIEETNETREQLLAHSHVISVELVVGNDKPIKSLSQSTEEVLVEDKPTVVKKLKK